MRKKFSDLEAGQCFKWAQSHRTVYRKDSDQTCHHKHLTFAVNGDPKVIPGKIVDGKFVAN